ncbi:hypothetical protein EYC84_005070 [Monilinia fructicola]|uniref:RRM domain-containing protein n=1 Tax=Monilinia fructicola TaxID=38448 RepID=A0A5M9K3Q4_MONFR|nr:hypothetical protein EYC84_005070 [Monilinia fructicola]
MIILRDNPIVSLAERNRTEDVRVHRPERQQEESPETLQAIAEGRRVYLGNLLYNTTPDKINAFLADNGGICFIEFEEKKNADEAMEVLEGIPLSGRAVKCRPCRPKGNVRRGGPGQRDRDENSNHNRNRWGNWEDSAASDSQPVPKKKVDSFMLVGWLPRMLDQSENELEIRSLFKDFQVDGVSKRISPRDNYGNNSRRNFCFVDFTTPEEAQAARPAARQAIDGQLYRDAPLKVSAVLPRSERQRK